MRELLPEALAALGAGQPAETVLEHLVREFEAHCRAFLESAVDGVLALDASGRIVSVNRATERLFGYREDELLGLRLAVLTADEGQLAGSRQLPARRKDGTEFPAEFTVRNMRQNGFTVYVRDLTEIIELARQKVHGQAILDMAVDAILTIDGRGLIRSANRAAGTMFGYTQGELLGQNVSLLMPEPHRSEHDGYLARYLETGKRRIIGVGRQATARRKDGSLFPAHLAISEIVLDGERLFTGFIRDISDVVALESEMVRRETEFLEREASLVTEERKYISRELHDSVSQALFGIVLGAQSALNALEKPERAREALDYVLSLAESGLAEMRALILELRPESLESEGLIGSLTRQLKAFGRRYSLETRTHFGAEPELPLHVKHECYRVALEAMNNVIKHAGARNLSLRVESESLDLVLEVVDDGVGFDPAQVPRSRVGLQSMRERVQGVGGRLELSTAPGQGTRVRAAFPLS